MNVEKCVFIIKSGSMSVQYETPISQESYQQVGLGSVIIGFFILAYFFIYQGAYKNRDRSIAFEVVLASLAAATLGVGVFFSGLSVGIYM